MKIQDIAFLLVLLFLIYKRNSKWAVILGLISLILAIPLFATWTFFTAERLTWYAGAFFLLSIIFSFWVKKGKSVKIKE
jgi:uncharacterized membrane protein HdeD (DUF308 family)